MKIIKVWMEQGQVRSKNRMDTNALDLGLLLKAMEILTRLRDCGLGMRYPVPGAPSFTIALGGYPMERPDFTLEEWEEIQRHLREQGCADIERPDFTQEEWDTLEREMQCTRFYLERKGSYALYEIMPMCAGTGGEVLGQVTVSYVGDHACVSPVDPAGKFADYFAAAMLLNPKMPN